MIKAVRDPLETANKNLSKLNKQAESIRLRLRNNTEGDTLNIRNGLRDDLVILSTRIGILKTLRSDIAVRRARVKVAELAAKRTKAVPIQF